MTDESRHFHLAHDERFLSELSRLRARASLRELVGVERRAEVDSINWQLDLWGISKASIALHSQVRSAVMQESSDQQDLRQAALVDARGWEALAGLEDYANTFAALINSAVAYEVAGYQANASCVARAAERNLGSRPAPTLQLAASVFVQRQFLRLEEFTTALNRPPNLRSLLRSGVAVDARLEDLDDQALSDLLTDDDVAHLVAQSFAAQGLQEAGKHFLSGGAAHLERASSLLAAALEGFTTAGSVRESNLLSNLQTLIQVMEGRSTWAVLGEFHREDARWRRYLRVLARGIGRTPRNARSISELWPSQLVAVKGGLLDSHESKVVRMPTSAGKTRVAELAIVHSLLSRPGQTCLYIAPFRALAEEVESSLDGMLGEIGFGATSLIGGPEALGIEEAVTADAQVLVLTPEKADLLLRTNPGLMESVSLVVLDEGHIVGDERRGPTFELLISRLRRRLTTARFLFLSAVVPDETLQDFAAWLGASGGQGILTSEWRPAIQRVASFEWTSGGGTLRYRQSSAGSDEVAAFERFLPRLIPDRPFSFVNPVSGRTNTRRFPDPNNRSQLIAALAFEFVNTGPVLMFCPQTNFAEACAKALQTRIDLAHRVGETVPGAFTRREYPSAEVAASWLGEDAAITNLLRVGVGVHHGRLPDPVRRAVEDDFKAGRLLVLAATNTLGQGVNLPVRTVLVHSVRRRDDSGVETRLPARDYWNIAGRAGRAGFETDGLIVHLMLNARDKKDFAYFLEHSRDVEPVVSSLFRVLRNLVSNRISSDEALAELEPGLMALLVEEGEEELQARISHVEPLLAGSLVGIQAARYEENIDALSTVAVDGARYLTESLPFSDLLTFSRTGLTSRSCLHLKKHAEEYADEVRTLFASPQVAPEIVTLILEGLAGVEEMQPERAFDGNYDDLLKEWIDGHPVPHIATSLLGLEGEVTDVATLARVLEEAATYLFPWGFSAYLQIAEQALNVAPSKAVSALPGLVRYGVPEPSAAWLMAFGVTDRSVAVAIAQEYLEGGGPNDVSILRDWLRKADVMNLSSLIGRSSQVLSEVSRVLERTRRSELATNLQAGPLLPRVGNVAVTDSEAQLALALLKPGDAVHLVRDYDSSLDRNLIRVFSKGHEVGKLDTATSSVIAIELDAGLSVQSSVQSIAMTDSGHGLLSLLLSVAQPH